MLVKKKLFISTGFYSTLIASVLAQSRSDGNDHLIITIDRQSVESNTLWAHRLHGWKSVISIDHEDYYIEKINYKHSVDFFDEVYSPFPEMLTVISNAFPADQYIFYEEGLTSYLQFCTNKYISKAKFHCIHPFIFNQSPELISLPVSIKTVLEKLKSVENCYKIPEIKGENNVVVIGHGGFPDENKNEILIGEYLETIKEFSQKGMNVILLGHTRFPVSELLLDTLIKSNDVNFKYIENDAPLSDLFLLKNLGKIRCISGIYSTLLVNAKCLFGLEVFSFDSMALSDRQLLLKDVQSQLIF